MGRIYYRYVYVGRTFKGDVDIVESDIVVGGDGDGALDAVAGGVGIDQTGLLAVQIDGDFGTCARGKLLEGAGGAGDDGGCHGDV
jgi:hypothetical protein